MPMPEGPRPKTVARAAMIVKAALPFGKAGTSILVLMKKTGLDIGQARRALAYAVSAKLMRRVRDGRLPPFYAAVRKEEVDAASDADE